MNKWKKLHTKFLFIVFFCSAGITYGQETQIRGFAEVLSNYQKKRVAFSLGEQDLFITSDLSNRFNFLGETVFKYSASSPTLFDISVERIVIKYNFYGNHNILIGKHHTPVNYWNDTYHHGRVFFPTIYRPDLFNDHVIPLHTTGISVQGHDLGKLKFGYDLMVGNGIGSADANDTVKAKSITAAAHFKPVDHLRIGVSYYTDKIPAGVKDAHGTMVLKKEIDQQLLTGSISYFGRRIEFLAESTFVMDKTDSTGTKNSTAAYAYAGFRIHNIVPYVRYDYLHAPAGELFLPADTKTTIVAGIRNEINYLTVVKLEFQHSESDMAKTSNVVTAQIAVGF